MRGYNEFDDYRRWSFNWWVLKFLPQATWIAFLVLYGCVVTHATCQLYNKNLDTRTWICASMEIVTMNQLLMLIAIAQRKEK
jgi:hypothetical protein